MKSNLVVLKDYLKQFPYFFRVGVVIDELSFEDILDIGVVEAKLSPGAIGLGMPNLHILLII